MPKKTIGKPLPPTSVKTIYRKQTQSTRPPGRPVVSLPKPSGKTVTPQNKPMRRP